jgi:hypothetical protein
MALVTPNPDVQALAQSVKSVIKNLLDKEVAGNLTDNELKIGLGKVLLQLADIDHHTGHNPGS